MAACAECDWFPRVAGLSGHYHGTLLPVLTVFVIFVIGCFCSGSRHAPQGGLARPSGAIMGALIIVMIGVAAPDAWPAAEFQSKPATLTIVPSDRNSTPRKFTIVLLCDTNETRTRGLQGFRQLKADEAALFVFDEPEIVSFWMASVAYPIDIIFVGLDGTVLLVYPARRPGSRELYPSLARAKWAIETAAGSGIRAGDRVMIDGAGSGERKRLEGTRP